MNGWRPMISRSLQRDRSRPGCRFDYNGSRSLTDLCTGLCPRASQTHQIRDDSRRADVAVGLAPRGREGDPCARPRSQSALVLVIDLAIGDRAEAQTAFSVSAHIGDFHVAVANYYRVPEREVIVIRERRIHDDEIPVALFIARHAGVPSARVVDMRLRGDSWWNISVRLGLSPEVYYVPVAVMPGPPYGRALGHYKKKHRKEWKTIVLTDADVVNLVELRFLSEHYRVAPEHIIALRADNRDFVAIHADVRRHKSRGANNNDDDRGQGGNGRGKGKHSKN